MLVNQVEGFVNSRAQRSFLEHVTSLVERTHPPMNGFAWFGIINYPIFYFIWQNTDPNPSLSICLRVIATGLSILLLCRAHWPIRLKPYLPIFWLFTVWFCLPFFACLLLLVNQLSSTWTLNVMFTLCLMLVLLDWASFAILFLLAGVVSWIVFVIMNDPVAVDQLFIQNRFQGFDIILMMTLFAGAWLSYELDQKRREALRIKLEVMKAFGGSIAHELRTPLSAIKLAADGVRLRLKKSLSYGQHDVQTQLGHVDQGLDHIQHEVDAANLVIDMLLMNIRQGNLPKENICRCSLSKTVTEALMRYPFSRGQRERVDWQIPERDIVFEGDPLWIEHVIFNLLKNALYAIHGQADGSIVLSCTHQPRPQLSFKDNGGGIPADRLAHVFDQFFSKTRHGTGLGLAFCRLVMEAVGGQIQCISTAGESTTFLLSFPTHPEEKGA